MRLLFYLVSMCFHTVAFIAIVILGPERILWHIDNIVVRKILAFLIIAGIIYFSHRVSRNFVYERLNYFESLKRAFFLKLSNP